LRIGTVGSNHVIEPSAPRPAATGIVRFFSHVAPSLVREEFPGGIAERDGIVAGDRVVVKIRHDAAVDPTAGDNAMIVVLRKQVPRLIGAAIIAYDCAFGTGEGSRGKHQQCDK
jgi:hypothetical protein